MAGHHIVADISALWNDVHNLFRTTSAFCDADVVGTAMCRNILIASCGATGADFHRLETELQAVQPLVSSALVGLIQGQEVCLPECSAFFDLFGLAQRLQVKACMELCKEVVASSRHESLPITLRLTAEQGASVRASLARRPQLADAALRVRQAEVDADSTEDSTQRPAKRQAIRVHRALLAASCEYIRGLWAGGFREAAGAHELEVDDADEGCLRALVRVVNGERAEVQSLAEVIQLFRFADRWQCAAVKTATLVHIVQHLTPVEASKLLEEPPPLPTELLKFSAVALAQDLPKTMSWKMAVHLVEASSDIQEHEELLRKATECVVSGLGAASGGVAWAVKFLNLANSDQLTKADPRYLAVSSSRTWAVSAIDQLQKTPEWLQIQPQVMGVLLAEVISTDKSHCIEAAEVLRWARQCCGKDVRQAIVFVGSVLAAGFKDDPPAAAQKLIHECLEIDACGDAAAYIIREALNIASVAPKIAVAIADDLEIPAAKRQKTHAGADDKRDLEFVVAAAKAWLGKGDRFGTFSASTSWQELETEALLEAVGAAHPDAVEAAVDRWVQRASGDAVFEALALAISAPGVNGIADAIQRAARTRFLALDGGKLREEIERVTKDARAAAAASAAAEKAELQKEFVARERELLEQIAEIQRQRDDAIELRRKAINDVRTLFDKVMQGAFGVDSVTAKEAS